ncbi:MAG: 2-phospho-L-lactate guanylyltransferase [Pseudomonadota bacterium]
MTRTLITVPMKAVGGAKTRLSDHLSDVQRDRLVRLLYRRTLDFLQPFGRTGSTDLAVVTASAEAAALAAAHGFAVIDEPENAGLSGAAERAAAWAVAAGYDRLCILPADLAAPLAGDLEQVLASRADMVLCPSTDRGTNALLLSPPDAIRFRYGPLSALRHLDEAAARGLHAMVMPLESLSFDIDTAPCLTRAMAQVPALAELRA